MARTAETQTVHSKSVGPVPEEQWTGFDVTCTVGTVDLRDGSGMSGIDAAFLLIAQHDAPGEYAFRVPMSGHKTIVIVEHVEVR